MRPKVSVIMAVLNGQRFIDEAIQSIVDQTYPNRELVVIDDGSTDDTARRIDAFRDRLEIRYVRHEQNQGIARSVNDGLRNATGDLIAFLDHDDAWFPHFLETQAQYLEQHPEVAMVHSDFQTIDVEGRVIERSVAASRGHRRPSGDVFAALFMDSFVVGNSVLIRRECFNRLGGFDESLRWGDYHMWLRLALHYRVDYVDQVLTKYRQHPTQDTRSASDARPDEAPVALQALEKILAQFPEARLKVGETAIRRRTAAFYFDLAYGWYTREETAKARVCLHRALRVWPTNRRYLMLYLASVLRPSQARAARVAWQRLRGREANATGAVKGITG